jgi:hypothetical protein
MTEFLLIYRMKEITMRGNEVNSFCIRLYAMLSFLALLGIVLGIGQLALVMVREVRRFSITGLSQR